MIKQTSNLWLSVDTLKNLSKHQLDVFICFCHAFFPRQITIICNSVSLLYHDEHFEMKNE